MAEKDKKVKLFMISQEVNHDYDTYDSAIVAAESPEAARRLHPNGTHIWSDALKGWVEEGKNKVDEWRAKDWVGDIDRVSVAYIGEAAGGVHRVIHSSFNAG
jgi:hypothetical protein